MDPLLLSLVGMSAFGSAVVGAPLAMTFLALETTGNFVVAGSVLAAVTVAGLVTRRLFGYSFATWRFHLRGETIRSAHDIGWLRELSVGKLMRRDLRTVRSDTRLASFKRDFPLGSTARVVAVDEKDQYAGLISVPEAYAAAPEVETVEPLLQFRDRALLPAMNAKEAMAVFDTVETEALAVVDGVGSRKVLGLLTASHLLRRYGEEVERRVVVHGPLTVRGLAQRSAVAVVGVLAQAGVGDNHHVGQGGLDRWASAWETLQRLPSEVEALNLDRADALFTALTELRDAARA